MFELHGSIAVITLNSPPVNSLGAALRQHIAAAVHQGVLDPAVHAMVLIGNAKAFSAGADVTQSAGTVTAGTLRSAAGIGGSLSLPQATNAVSVACGSGLNEHITTGG